jgi:hypothetical protein
MRRSNSILIGWQTAILALVVFLCGLPVPAYCQGPILRPFAKWEPQADGTVLLLQQTPPEAGKITPGVGVHSFESDTEVTLTAVAKPGYQFVYWLGDVSEPTANRTIVYLDAPKIIIAVFERSEYEFLFVQERSQNAPAGGLYISGAVAGQGGFVGGGGERPPKWRWPPPEPEESEPIPVPEEGDDFPVPIPEPATVCLLGLGGLILLRRRRRAYIL